MHVEPPEGHLRSLKDFAKHYAMIVVSILTALALEQAFEAWHHREAAEQATREIEHELAGNLDELQHAMQTNAARAPELDAVCDRLEEALRQGRSVDAMRHEIIEPASRSMTLGFEFPSLQREAWERAVASQSASWIEPSRLGRFSAAYAAQRDITPLAYESMRMLVDGRQLIDVMTDVRLGRVDPVAFVHVVRQYQAAIGAVQSNLKDLRTQIGAAAHPDGREPAGATASDASASSPGLAASQASAAGNPASR